MTDFDDEPADRTPEADAAPEAAQDAAGEAIDTEAGSAPARDVAAALATLRADSRDPATGRFKPGGFARLQHGKRAPRLWAAPPLAALLTERVESLENDYGGREHLSTAEHALVVELGRLELLTAAAGEQLTRAGLTTSKGRVRAAASLWLGLLDRQVRLAQTLGLQRRAKPVDDLRAWAQKATNDAPAIP